MKLIKVIFSLVTSLALSWLILFTPSFAIQTAAQAQNIEVINAWYGDDTKNAQASYATSSKIVPKLKEVLNKYGFIAIPAQMHTFYGIDPLPNIPKKTAIHIRYNGKEEHLRAPEGTDFIFPSNVDSALAQKALQEIKASLPATFAPKIDGRPPAVTDAQKLSRAIGEDGDFNLARQLIEKGVKIEGPPLTRIHGGIRSDAVKKETVPARLAFAEYLIEKGYDINQPGHEPLVTLAHKIVMGFTQLDMQLMDLFYGPLMELYIKAGASLEQIQKARQILTDKQCLRVGGCGVDCAPCVVFGYYWRNKIEPLIQEKIKTQTAVFQDVQNAITNNDVTTLKRLIDQKKITANQIIELASKASKYALVQAITQYIEQKK